MKLFLFLCFFSLSLEASCTNEQVEHARELYTLAINENLPGQKIDFLEGALASCYAPEIEANLFILKALQSKETNTQVDFYKKSLLSISKFKNKTEMIRYQNKVNRTISTLLKQTNPQLSEMYRAKEIKEDKNSKKRNHIWIYIVFGSLFLWGVYKNIKS